MQDWLAHLGIVFRPASPEQLARVRMTPSEARSRALLSAPEVVGTERIVWTHVGCTFLGEYQNNMFPRHGDRSPAPMFVAYIVQVIGPPLKSGPRYLNVRAVVFNAETGEEQQGFGFSDEPVLGTTCGSTAAVAVVA